MGVLAQSNGMSVPGVLFIVAFVAVIAWVFFTRTREGVFLRQVPDSLRSYKREQELAREREQFQERAVAKAASSAERTDVPLDERLEAMRDYSAFLPKDEGGKP